MRISFGCGDSTDAARSKGTWFPYTKGGGYKKWYGNQEYVVNWGVDGIEIKQIKPSSVIRNPKFYFREGLTFSSVSSKGFAVRYLPPGFIFDQKGWGVFTHLNSFSLLGYMNSRVLELFMGLNPTISFGDAELSGSPVEVEILTSKELAQESTEAVRLLMTQANRDETTIDFIATLRWDICLGDLSAAQARLADLEHQIDDEVYRLYGISDEDRAAIEAELAGGTDTEEEAEPKVPITREELAIRWISSAVGIVLGRFQPGLPPDVGGDGRGGLGSAVYRREDFAVGSLPTPDEAEFDQLVGSPKRFVYVDADGGRHLFPAEVEAALRDLAVPDGIAVLDEGHPRDLPTLVDKALTLMLGAEATQEVIAVGANGDLRKFLERNFFTKWHFKWYRKRPVYWPLQSAKGSHGFVLFHERVNRSTLYVLQRDYLDHKLNGLRLHIGDLTAQLEGKEGRARKQVERQIDKASQLLDEITEFAGTMEQVVREGYEPAPDWIDDGVILRLAPLWELIPIWKREPKKYWERLQQGDYDWSHIAMRYWPERVREKCKTNKSFAIAHRHEEWYEEDR